jgi:SPP1 gp7 family putative phage head morphogenesis protein
MRRKQRNDNIVRGGKLNYNASLQAKYSAAIRSLIKKMVAETKQEIVKLFESNTAVEFYESLPAAMDASISSQAKIVTDKLMAKFERLFDMKSKGMAEKMVKDSNKASGVALKISLKKISKNITIKTDILSGPLKEVAKASIAENVGLIRTIPKTYLSKVQGSVMRSITTGNGLKSLIPALEKYEGITYRHAKNVALDQTRKVYNALNANRMQDAGVGSFEWVHSGGGQEPRKSHIAMSGKVYSFKDLPVINKEQVEKGYESPEHGTPGQAINCGCTMIPVIKFNGEKK